MLGGVEFKSLEAANSKHLERQFSEEQVVTALHQISGEKALGPDDFTLAFFQQCWEVVKVEVLNTIQEFYEHEEFERNLNSTFVVLIPSKVAFFMWLATHDKNLTIDNLRRRRHYVVEWCFMCKRDSETGAHLFLHCAYAWELWSLVFCMFGIQWTMPSTVAKLLACWKRRGLTKDHNTIWNVIPGCLMWMIWREQNQRAFEDIERHAVDLKLIFIRTLMEWMAAGSSQVYPSILSFIDDCL